MIPEERSGLQEKLRATVKLNVWAKIRPLFKRLLANSSKNNNSVYVSKIYDNKGKKWVSGEEVYGYKVLTLFVK